MTCLRFDIVRYIFRNTICTHSRSNRFNIDIHDTQLVLQKSPIVLQGQDVKDRIDTCPTPETFRRTVPPQHADRTGSFHDNPLDIDTVVCEMTSLRRAPSSADDLS